MSASPGRASDSVRSRAQSRTEKLFVWMFAASLLWAPFFLGGNRPLAWGINAALFCGLAAAYEITLAVTAGAGP